MTNIVLTMKSSIYNRLKNQSAPRGERGATSKSIGTTKTRKRTFLISEKQISPIDTNALAERNHAAQEHMPKGHIEVPKLYTANVKGTILNLQKKALIEAVGREKIAGATSVNDLLAVSGAYKKLKTVENIVGKREMNIPLKNLPVKTRWGLYDLFSSEIKKGSQLQTEVKQVALAIALNLTPKRK